MGETMSSVIAEINDVRARLIDNHPTTDGSRLRTRLLELRERLFELLRENNNKRQ